MLSTFPTWSTKIAPVSMHCELSRSIDSQWFIFKKIINVLLLLPIWRNGFKTNINIFFSTCMYVYILSIQPTLTENKKKALFYIITACWSKSWTVGHRVVHTQCLNFFYICLYIFIMYVVLCVYVVWYVFYSITLHYYSFFQSTHFSNTIFYVCIFNLLS